MGPQVMAVIMILCLLYVSALALVLVFLAGAAIRSQRWDDSNRVLWQRARTYRWRDEAAA